MNQQQNEIQENTAKKKIKERISTEELRSMLAQWIEAIDQKKDLEVQIKGQPCKVPVSAVLSNNTAAEFEFKKGEFEFELELKWKDDSAKLQ